jgi:hypothetical protein
MMASCPGEPNAHVKFKLDLAIDSGLIISLSRRWKRRRVVAEWAGLKGKKDG